MWLECFRNSKEASAAEADWERVGSRRRVLSDEMGARGRLVRDNI